VPSPPGSCGTAASRVADSAVVADAPVADRSQHSVREVRRHLWRPPARRLRFDSRLPVRVPADPVAADCRLHRPASRGRELRSVRATRRHQASPDIQRFVGGHRQGAVAQGYPCRSSRRVTPLLRRDPRASAAVRLAGRREHTPPVRDGPGRALQPIVGLHASARPGASVGALTKTTNADRSAGNDALSIRRDVRARARIPARRHHDQRRSFRQVDAGRVHRASLAGKHGQVLRQGSRRAGDLQYELRDRQQFVA